MTTKSICKLLFFPDGVFRTEIIIPSTRLSASHSLPSFSDSDMTLKEVVARADKRAINRNDELP